MCQMLFNYTWLRIHAILRFNERKKLVPFIAKRGKMQSEKERVNIMCVRTRCKCPNRLGLTHDKRLPTSHFSRNEYRIDQMDVIDRIKVSLPSSLCVCNASVLFLQTKVISYVCSTLFRRRTSHQLAAQHSTLNIGTFSFSSCFICSYFTFYVDYYFKGVSGNYEIIFVTHYISIWWHFWCPVRVEWFVMVVAAVTVVSVHGKWQRVSAHA